MLKDLQRIVSLQPNSQRLDALKGTSFNVFWDRIGPPINKQGKPSPIHPYETKLIQALEQSKYHAILKATGLGISELFLRWIAWQCLKDDRLNGCEVVIMVGPREQLAITLIQRLKGLFPDEAFDSDMTTCILNSCHVKAYPSHALASARGLTNVKIVFIDEASFFHPNEAQECRAVSERYIAKSDPYIILVSTPNQPNDLMDQIIKESPSIYKKHLLAYNVGLGNIYNQKEIDEAHKSPTFEREYNLKFGFNTGNLAKPEDLDGCFVDYDLSSYPYSEIKLAIDPAWGVSDSSSKYGIVACGLVDGFVRVFYAEAFKALSFDQAEGIVKGLIDKYNPSKVYIDGANPAVVKSCKALTGENVNYESEPKDSDRFWKVQPINFNTEGRPMLGNLQELISKHILQIHPDFIELQGELRASQIGDDGKLDKTYSSFDLVDALRMACRSYKLG